MNPQTPWQQVSAKKHSKKQVSVRYEHTPVQCTQYMHKHRPKFQQGASRTLTSTCVEEQKGLKIY